MKVLITGGSSLLGRYLLKTIPDPQWTVYPTWYSNYVKDIPMLRLDVCDPEQVKYIFGRVNPDIVIHCAGVGDVDYAQTHYGEVERINVGGTRNVVDAANEYRAMLVYPSTNAVFDGKAPPYSEDSERRPVNAYGAIRARAENIVMDTCKSYLLVRLFLLYGWPWLNGRTNWAIRAMQALKDGRHLKMVDDRFWQPTYAGDAAEGIWKLLRFEESGVFHVASDVPVTLYEFTKAVAMVLNLDQSLIEPVPSSTYQSMAPRPVDTTYRLDKARELGVICSGMAFGLRNMFDEVR